MKAIRLGCHATRKKMIRNSCTILSRIAERSSEVDWNMMLEYILLETWFFTNFKFM